MRRISCWTLVALGVMTLAPLAISTAAAAPRTAPIIVDHRATNLSAIPTAPTDWIGVAKANLHIAYGHTSHGSQLTDGMTGLAAWKGDRYAWNRGGLDGALDLDDGGSGGLPNDVGYYPDWYNATLSFLGAVNPSTGRGSSHPNVNVIIWSWCGQAAGRTQETMLSTYLTPMSQLEAAYPGVTFVYMTGHLDGSGASGNLNLRNQQIRDYVTANNKVLYDFADIESYDPDGLVNYMELNAGQGDGDGCAYNGGNWCLAWQGSHVEGVDWYSCSSAHSYPLNANRKAYAAWWLWARLAGWEESLSMADASATEGNEASAPTSFAASAPEAAAATTPVSFEATLSAASATTVTVSFATVPGTATADVDYVTNSGILTFLPGEITKTVTVTINGDLIDEPNETFSVVLSNPSNATITKGEGVGTIIDDDTPTVSASIGDVSLPEGNSGQTSANFPVTLSGPATQETQIDYVTANGTANAGSDYNTTAGTLVIPQGATGGTISIAVLGDTTVEPDETFTVTLSDAWGVILTDSVATGTITNDDSALVAEPVVWTNASGVSVSANALLKTGATGWNAGASSTYAIADGSGYTEITIPTGPGDAMFGLSNGDDNLGYADIDYAFYVYATGGRFIIYEKGVGTGRNGTYATGDKLRVAVNSGVVTYWQNGSLVYTSTATATYPLRVDTSLRTTGAKIEGAVLAGNLVSVAPPPPTPELVGWTNASGVSVSANALLKTGAVGWNAGASSTRAIANGSGYAEITVPTNPGDAMFGLSNGDSNLGYADIDYAFYVYATGGTFIIYEKGVGTGRNGTFAVGDKLRVAVESGVVTYWQNGALVYTSAATATYPLSVDTSLRTTGAKIEGAVLAGNLVNVVVWTNASGVSVSANALLKTGAIGWNAGASSTYAIADGSGYVEITIPTGPGDAMFGLSNGDDNLGYADIDYAFYVYATGGTFIIYEKGVGTGRHGTFAVGDRLRVTVNSGVVTYWQNGSLVYTSAATATYPLRVDTSLRTTGAKIEGAVLVGNLVNVAPPPPTPEPVEWTNASGVSVSANNLLKTGAVGWNAGASSTRAIANGSGYAEITVPTGPGDAMFGLSNGDSNLGYADIDYAFYVYQTSGIFIIYEKGLGTGRNGTYATGDKLRVAVNSGVVTYWQNGALVYTSAATATYPLRVDTSLRTTGAKIEGAVLAGTLE